MGDPPVFPRMVFQHFQFLRGQESAVGGDWGQALISRPPPSALWSMVFPMLAGLSQLTADFNFVSGGEAGLGQ